MAEEEPEGMRMATGGIPAQKWELPTGLILEKSRGYGVNLFANYVTVKIDTQGRNISIDWDGAFLFDWAQMHDIEEQAVEDEVQLLLDSDVVPDEVEDDEGNMVKLTDEEREERARDMADHSDLEYGSETLGWLARNIDDDDGIPGMFRKEVRTFWSDPNRGWEPERGERPENEMTWLAPGEEAFLEAVREAQRNIIVEEGGAPSILKAYALAVTEIMERLNRQDFMATFRKIIPVWSYMRLKYELKEKADKHRKRYKQLRESWEKSGTLSPNLTHDEHDYMNDYVRLTQMRQWLKTHKTEMSEAARRMLDKKETGGMAPKAIEKGKQMTVEMKKAKLTPRFNPDIADNLADYYHAVGIDPEVPVGWLMAEGAMPEQIAEAADELLKADRIDPPDYWAITAAVAGADYHVGVPRGNPTATEELAGRKKLQKAVQEKHGKLPDEIDRVFKQLRARQKGKTDEEIMDMTREQLGLKKRKNPSFKNARDALKNALKRMTTIEVVEYKLYEPPVAEPTLEHDLESLERTAKEVIAEEEEKESGVKALEELQAGLVQDEWKQMFEQERREHPALPEEVIKTIVEDHMKTEKRENPSVEDKVIKAFWEEEEARGPIATPMRDTGTGADRRDEVEVRGGPFMPGRPGFSIVRYMLWGNNIASLDKDDRGHKTFGISTAGWDTNLTNNRLNAILSAGQEKYPILRRFRISKDRGIRLYKFYKVRKLDPKKPWQTYKWDEICPVPETIYSPRDLPKGQMAKYSVYIDLDATLKENIERLTGKALKQEIEEMEIPANTLEEVQMAIDSIEKDIVEYRAANRDFDSTPIEVAEKLGKRQRFEELLKQRDELMWRGNPKIPYTPPDAPDVEVRCPVTGKYTWSCTQCALFKGRSEQFIECAAKKGKRYYLASARDKRGTVWDTYVLPRGQRKAGIETRATGGD